MSRFFEHRSEVEKKLKKYVFPICGFKILKWTVIFIGIFTNVYGQSNAVLFEQANKLYRSEKYSEAIGLYEKIEANGQMSSELYYNLGNSYYKLNKIAPSIYNLEKALAINPNNSDASNNLVFSNRMAIDAIEELPKTFFQNLEIEIIQRLTFNQWAYIAVSLAISACLFFLFFYFSYVPLRKRAYFIVSAVSFFFLIFSLLFTFKQYDTSLTSIEAIVFSEKVSVKSAPLDSGQEVFEIHEGLKVVVLDEVDVWKKIKLADGKTGWIQSEVLKIL